MNGCVQLNPIYGLEGFSLPAGLEPGGTNYEFTKYKNHYSAWLPQNKVDIWLLMENPYVT